MIKIKRETPSFFTKNIKRLHANGSRCLHPPLFAKDAIMCRRPNFFYRAYHRPSRPSWWGDNTNNISPTPCTPRFVRGKLGQYTHTPQSPCASKQGTTHSALSIVQRQPCLSPGAHASSMASRSSVSVRELFVAWSLHIPTMASAFS